MTDAVTRTEVNGLGERIAKMSIILAKTETRSETNEKNIEKLSESFETKSKEFSAKADKLSNSVVLGSFVLVIGLILKEVFFK
jgi:Na+/glutamate symporter